MERKEWVKRNLENTINDICDVVNIRSLRSTSKENMPFGKSVSDALDFFVQKAKSFDLQVKNYNGYAVEIQIGSGNDLIGVLGHVDVVDGGDGWTTNPFKAEILDGRIYGRGTVDDKGPLVCALYAMKYIQEHNLLPPGVRARLIIGGDEESLWECMDYYKAHTDDLPLISMVVDGNFPVIYCEKGLLDFNMIWKEDTYRGGYEIEVRNITGGTAKNVVPSYAACDLVPGSADLSAAVEQYLIEKKVSYKKEAHVYQVSFTGRPTHAMNPEKGINAVSLMVKFLADITAGRKSNVNTFAESYNRLIGLDYNGRNLGIDCEDLETGPLTFNTGIIKSQRGQILVEANIRIPASRKYEEIVPAMAERLQKNYIEYEEESFLDSIHLDPDSREITTLMNVYQEITKDYDSQPIAIGGATYARCLRNAVSFGPIFPGQEDRTHEADEFLSIEDIEKLLMLYIEGVCRLARLHRT